MQADMAVAHLPFQLRPRHQGCDAVHHQHVDGARPHQRVADLERLFARIRLADQQVVHIHAELAGIARVERVFGIDEGAGAAALLRFRDGVQRQRRLARAFRPVDLHDPALRQPADAEREVEAERAGRDHLDLRIGGLVAHAHDRALAEGPLDLAQRGVQSLRLVHGALPFPDISMQPMREIEAKITTPNRRLSAPCPIPRHQSKARGRQRGAEAGLWPAAAPSTRTLRELLTSPSGSRGPVARARDQKGRMMSRSSCP